MEALLSLVCTFWGRVGLRIDRLDRMAALAPFGSSLAPLGLSYWC